MRLLNVGVDEHGAVARDRQRAVCAKKNEERENEVGKKNETNMPPQMLSFGSSQYALLKSDRRPDLMARTAPTAPPLCTNCSASSPQSVHCSVTESRSLSCMSRLESSREQTQCKCAHVSARGLPLCPLPLCPFFVFVCLSGSCLFERCG